MLKSIQPVAFTTANIASKQNVKKADLAQKNVATNVFYSKNYAQALKTNGINLSRTVAFTGALYGAFSELNSSMKTCKGLDEKGNDKGEVVGSRANVNKLLHDYAGDFSQPDDAIKTTIKTSTTKLEDGTEVPVYARTQIKLISQNDDNQKLRFEMAVRKPTEKDVKLGDKTESLSQLVRVDMTPINYKADGVREQAYILNTKGNLMAVVEDGDDVLLTNAGKITKSNATPGELDVYATQYKNVFKPFTAPVQDVVERMPLPSIGEGSEIVIGMENGRFVNEIKASIAEFVEKVNNEEIVLPQFVAAPNAKNTQLIMLAGGFGSRAEYTNASSSAIFHDVDGGTQSTKGVFRTATGLTPMETTLVTLHMAGLLDCSKGKLGIGKNIKFYLNEGQNRGNGEFSADLYASMPRDGRKAAIIFPNDSMSRMTNAVIQANELINSGKAAIAMIAKKVKAQDCIKTFGIMKYDPETKQILGFAEKPAVIPEGYADEDNMCVTNTFQFAVSDEAFEVLNMFEDYFVFKPGEKESRDWSKQYVPIIKTLTEETDYEVIKKQLAKSLGNTPENIPDSIIAKAKATLGDQKIYAVPTSEPWADCGTLNQLFHTTMEIASGVFPLEDFERAHVLDCVDTKTGLVATSKDQKERIAKKYDIKGQVMVVPQAKKVDMDLVSKIPVTVHRD